MRILVIGAYGLIGSEIARNLVAAGHDVTGLGRSLGTGRSLLPQISWIAADLSDLTTSDRWQPHIREMDAVINAAGLLQSGGSDNVKAVQLDAMVALFGALEADGTKKFVQISAPDVDPSATTEFMRTKAEADAVLSASKLDWVILRPGVVISHTAYGGTALLRMLAAFPMIQPYVLGDARLKTVAVDDVAHAVRRALSDQALNRRTFDLVEDDSHSLTEVLAAFRTWLGFKPPIAAIELPRLLGSLISAGADMAGKAGWRSPLRTTALQVMEEGVMGDPEPWRQATGMPLKNLGETLAALPSTAQERTYARAQLVFPILLIMLALFWIVSGVIGLVSWDEATRLISDQTGSTVAGALLIGGAAADIAIGLGLLVKRTLRFAAVASIGLSLGYLASGTFLTPDVWLDPLGPFVKVVPVIGASLALLAIGQDR